MFCIEFGHLHVFDGIVVISFIAGGLQLDVGVLFMGIKRHNDSFALTLTWGYLTQYGI